MNPILNGKPYRFIQGDALSALRELPTGSIDCMVTSPPYWAQRNYKLGADGIGSEPTASQYVEGLAAVFAEAASVLKPKGSLWLNLGDKYQHYRLLGLPWRVAHRLADDGWIIRQELIWHKLDGVTTATPPNRCRIVHEHIFHLVRTPRYWHDGEAVQVRAKSPPDKGHNEQRYYKMIRRTTALTEAEKIAATQAVKAAADKLRAGRIVGFRLKMRGAHKSIQSNGRLRNMAKHGFYILESKCFVLPTTIYGLASNSHRTDHPAAFPPGLPVLPIKFTCPPGGLVLDPFCGSGTTVTAALKLGRRGIGIDLNPDYIAEATKRAQAVTMPLDTPI